MDLLNGSFLPIRACLFPILFRNSRILKEICTLRAYIFNKQSEAAALKERQ